MNKLLINILGSIAIVCLIGAFVTLPVYWAVQDNHRIEIEAHNCFDRGGNVAIHERKVICSK